MAHTICTFNANNLFARYRFGQTFPGDRARRSLVGEGWGYLPQYDRDLIELFNPEQRDLAAAAITRDGSSLPDVVCLQEVESLLALRRFNEEHLGNGYRYALLIDSRDFRQIDVGILSNLDILSVRSHMDRLDPQGTATSPFLFSRDCLEVTVALDGNGSRTLTLFVNHLKSKYAESAEDRQRGDALRRRQAEAVRAIVRARFPGPAFDSEMFAVVGDLNDEPGSAPVRPLARDAGLVDALERIPAEEDRWTHWFRSENSVGQLDHVLLSPALDAATAGARPTIERRGIGFARILSDGSPGPRMTRFHRTDTDPNPIPIDFQFPRFTGVNPQDYASDHCPVFFTVP